MSIAQGYVQELQMTRKFFNTTISAFSEEDSGFAAKPGLLTVANHVAHVAETVHWFIEGAFGKGWDMDFEAAEKRNREVTSLATAKDRLDEAFEAVVRTIGEASDQVLCEPIPDKQIMEGAPRCSIVSAISDHTAHHRGALAVYARLLGKEPPMPYA
jgi:uncharacterized damage-inducible protein DinB